MSAPVNVPVSSEASTEPGRTPSPDARSLRAILPVATGGETARTFFQFARRHRGLSWAAVGVSMAASTASVAVPILLGRVVDLVVARGTVGTLVGLVVALLVAAIASGALTAVARWLTAALGATVCADLREQVMDRSLRMESARLEAAGSGDVTSRVTEDVELVNRSVQLAAGVFAAVVTVVTTMIGFATLDWRIAVAFCVVFPVYVIGLRILLPRARRRFAAERRAAAARTQTVLTTLHGSATVHAYGMERRQTARVEVASSVAVEAKLKTVWTGSTIANLMNYAEAVGLSAVLLAGFLLARVDAVSIGQVTAAALLFHRLFGPLGMLVMTFNDVLAAGAALARIVGVARLPQAASAPSDGHPADLHPPASGTHGGGLELTADHVRHAYAEGAEVVHDVSVRVPAGQSLAVVGESGAGKTTLAAILGGVFEPSAGEVRIGGRGLAELDATTLRRRIGVVTQEVHVFSGRLADDLRLAVPEASDEQLWAALELVGASTWVQALPERLATVVGEGQYPLTAAQAQQLALARIALADPPVVIMDEATAEAGSAGARQLELASAALLRGRTAVVVAHRLTQAAACDQIVVMSRGRIVESGTPQDLVAAGGAYAELWSAWHRA